MQRLAELFLIERGEVRHTVYFVVLFLLMGAGVAVGKGSADALFIRRYGVEYFPYVFMVFGVALSLSCVFYAAFVDRLSSESFMRTIFIVQVLLLATVSLAIRYHDDELVYPFYYLIYAISSEMLLVHGAVYIGQNFHTLQAKRLTPVILGGYQIGMMSGGFALMFIVPVIGLDLAPLLWMILVVCAGLLISWYHRDGRSPYYYRCARQPGTLLGDAIGEIGEGLAYTRRSRLLRNASMALFFLVIAVYLTSYSANTIYRDTFPDEEVLTSFFGLLAIVTNLVAMLIQFFFTSRLIQRFGIRRTSNIHPATTVASFALLLLYPGYYAALFASFNRETLMPAIRNPLWSLSFNVLPDKLKGRARAISVAVVVPLGLLLCGVLIILLEQVDGLMPVLAAGLVCALIYTWFNLMMGRNYISTLISSMKEKLYLPDEDALLYRDSSPELISAMVAGLHSDDMDVSLSYARAMMQAYPRESAEYIIERVRTLDHKTADQMLKMLDRESAREYAAELDEIAGSADNHLQATVFDILVQTDNGEKSERRIRQALEADDARLRVSAIFAACTGDRKALIQEALYTWKTLLDESGDSQMAALRLLPLLSVVPAHHGRYLRDLYYVVMPGLLDTGVEARSLSVIEALRHHRQKLPAVLADRVRPYLHADAPVMRAAAAALIYQLESGDERMQALWAALADGHALVRRAVMDAVMEHEPEPHRRLGLWLRQNRKGSPRAHMTILNELMSSRADAGILDEVIDLNLAYAAELLCAVDALDEEAGAGLLAISMRERIQRLCDIVLRGLQPSLDSASIAVIRAALNSGERRHIADAIEALDGLDDNDRVVQLSCLLKREAFRLRSRGMGLDFDTAADVFDWCAKLDDEWLRSCARYAAEETERIACA